MLYMNDAIINSYMLLLNYCPANWNANNEKQCLFFKTFLMNKLGVLSARDGLGYAVYNFGDVCNFLKAYGLGSILDKKFLFIPINDDNKKHWVNAWVDTLKKTVFMFDPLYSLNSRSDFMIRMAGAIVVLLKDIGKYEKKEECTWTVEYCETPKQENGVDCGVFLLAVAYYLIYNTDKCDLEALMRNNGNPWRGKIRRDILQGYIAEKKAVDVTPPVSTAAVATSSSNNEETVTVDESTFIRERYAKYKTLATDAYGSSQPIVNAVRDSSSEIFLG